MKHRAYLIGHRDDKVCFYIHPDDLTLFGYEMKKYSPKDLLTIEVKKWKARRTLTQNNFFHLLCDYLSHPSRMDMDAGLIKDGIKDRYGYKIEAFGKLIPKPSHLCNKLEEMSALIEGCFREAASQAIDVRDFVVHWEQLKRRKQGNDKSNVV